MYQFQGGRLIYFISGKSLKKSDINKHIQLIKVSKKCPF